LNRLSKQYHDRGLLVLGVSDERPNKIEPWMKRHGVEYPNARTPGFVGGLFGVRGIPHAVLIDAEGIVRWRGHPSQLQDSIIAPHLTGSPAPPLYPFISQANGGASSGGGLTGNIWLLLPFPLLLLFAVAAGWFWYRNSRYTPRVRAVTMPQPQYGALPGEMPPGAPPPQGYPPPPQGYPPPPQAFAPPPPPQGYATPGMQPPPQHPQQPPPPPQQQPQQRPKVERKDAPPWERDG
jgi:hypothetical protein